MTFHHAMLDTCDNAVLALTALERWAATRKVNPRATEEYSAIVAITLLLLALVILLWWVSHRRWHPRVQVSRQDLLVDGAERKGLAARERQVLLAIAIRSGLKRSHDIFTTPDAFDEGAGKLLDECARSRTPQEMERLRMEVAGLREKLAYRTPAKREQGASTSSRDIPVGTPVELLRRDHVDDPAIGAVVVRNDDLEIAVETQMPIDAAGRQEWRVRYRFGGRTWQFDTSSVAGEDRRLVLNHGEAVRAVQRDRAERLALQVPATVARFPFIQTGTVQPGEMPAAGWFELVHGVVTQVSDASLQIRSSLRVETGERVLVLFTLAAGEGDDGVQHGNRRSHIIGHVGRVKHRQMVDSETIITVDLTDLTSREIDELVRLAHAASGEQKQAVAPVMQGA